MNSNHRTSRKSPQLRIIVTPYCNLKCIYCRPGGEGYYENIKTIMTKEEIIEIIKLATQVGFTHVKFTGGEPLLRKDIFEIIENTREINGIREIQLVTNGTLLKGKAKKLKEAGIDYLTVSLDAVTPNIFRKIRKCDISSVIESLHECKDVGLPVRINMVVMKNNFSEIKPMIELSRKVKASLKLLDLIYMEGYSNYDFWKEEYLHFDKVRKLLFELGAEFTGYEDAPGGIGAPLEVYQLPNGVPVLLKDSTRGTYYHGTCEDCKYYPCQDAVISVRVTHDGKLKRCLIRNDNLVLILPLIRNGKKKEALNAMEEIFKIMVESRYYPKMWSPEVLISQVEERKYEK